MPISSHTCFRMNFANARHDKLEGVVGDQWRRWAKTTGEAAALDGAEALRRMPAGDFKAIDSIIATEERGDCCDVSSPYATVDASLFLRSDVSGITDLASLEGIPVGVKAGDQHIDSERESGATTVSALNNNGEIVKSAELHESDVFLIDVPSALYLLNKNGMASRFRRSVLTFHDQGRRAVRKGDMQTLSAVSRVFAASEPSELRRPDQQWFGHTSSAYENYVIYLGYAAAATVLLIAGLLGRNRAPSGKILQRKAALAESEQRFRQIAENVHEVFWLIALDSKEILYVSPTFEAVWGRSRNSLYQDPRSFSATVHPDDWQRVAQAMARDRERGFEVEYRIVRPTSPIGSWRRTQRNRQKSVFGSSSIRFPPWFGACGLKVGWISSINAAWIIRDCQSNRQLKIRRAQSIPTTGQESWKSG